MAAGCSSAQIDEFKSQWATVAGEIQQAVATAAAYIPTIESIAATAASLFGPGYTAIVTAGSALFNQIVATLTNIVNNLAPPRFREAGSASAYELPDSSDYHWRHSSEYQGGRLESLTAFFLLEHARAGLYFSPGFLLIAIGETL